MTSKKNAAKTPDAPPPGPVFDPAAKGLPIFTLYRDPSEQSATAPRRIVFDLELGCVIMDGRAPGLSVVHFGGSAYEIDASMEEAVDEILAVTVTPPPISPPAPIDVHQGETAPPADQSQEDGTEEEHAGT